MADKKNKKAKKVRDFYIHLITFLVVVIALSIISFINDEFTFYWLLFPISFPVFWEGLQTFVFNNRKDIKKKIEMKQVDRDN